MSIETDVEFLESVADGKSLTGEDRARLRRIAEWVDNHDPTPYCANCGACCRKSCNCGVDIDAAEYTLDKER